MSDCTVNQVYGSIEACPGRSVLAGIRRRLYFIPKSDIVKWPALPKLNATGNDAAKDMGALATYKGSFTLKADATWKFIDLKDNASNVTHDTAGELGSQIIENKATAIVAGTSKELAGFGRQSKNDDLVYVYQERDGAYRVLGNDMYSTDTAPTRPPRQQAQRPRRLPSLSTTTARHHTTRVTWSSARQQRLTV